jgi:hypothetical protein
MSNQIEKLIKVAYKKWKTEHLKAHNVHPDEEAWVCFLEGMLSREESEPLKAHLLSCDSCAEAFSIQVRLKPTSLKDVPAELLQRMKNLVASEERPSILDIVLRLGEKALEILNTTGDVLVGQEFVPALVLRSRQIKDFKDEVTILKDFKDIRVELKLENKAGEAFDLTVFIKDKQTHRVIKDLRVTLLKDDLELESYLTSSDRVIFEHVLVGKYTVEISNIESKVASVLLDIKK